MKIKAANKGSSTANSIAAIPEQSPKRRRMTRIGKAATLGGTPILIVLGDVGIFKSGHFRMVLPRTCYEPAKRLSCRFLMKLSCSVIRDARARAASKLTDAAAASLSDDSEAKTKP